MKTITLNTADVIWRKELYPRIEGNAAKVKEYSENIALLPPIEINQKNELIDGWHRWMAHAEKKQETIRAFVTKTGGDAELFLLAIERNSKFGMQLSQADKRSCAINIYKATPIEDRVKKKAILAEKLSVALRTISNWTDDIDEKVKSERDALIMRLHLRCATQEEIAAAVGMNQAQVSRVLCEIEKFQICINPVAFDEIENEQEREAAVVKHNADSANFSEDGFNPPIYNIWSYGKKTNAVDHFGNTEQQIVENLLWLYTRPFEIIVDPFAGGGSTIDVCCRRLRRCFASDRKPVESRVSEIRSHDICADLPSLRWSEVSLVYLDPPYWKQAENQYSTDAEDLANMPLPEFTEKLSGVVKAFAKKLRNDAVISLIIQPTQWKAEPKGVFVDHIFDLISAVGNKTLKVENRISCPYSTEQYKPQMVEWAKENKKPLVLTREMIVWRKHG